MKERKEKKSKVKTIMKDEREKELELEPKKKTKTKKSAIDIRRLTSNSINQSIMTSILRFSAAKRVKRSIDTDTSEERKKTKKSPVTSQQKRIPP